MKLKEILLRRHSECRLGRSFILCSTPPYYPILYCTEPYYIILYYTIVCYTTLYYTILYYTILFHTILYFMMRHLLSNLTSLCTTDIFHFYFICFLNAFVLFSPSDFCFFAHYLFFLHSSFALT